MDNNAINNLKVFEFLKFFILSGENISSSELNLGGASSIIFPSSLTGLQSI